MTRRADGIRHGLWTWTDDGIQPGHVRDNPRRRNCPACGADIGDPCRAAGREMRSYHPTRTEETDQ